MDSRLLNDLSIAFFAFVAGVMIGRRVFVWPLMCFVVLQLLFINAMKDYYAGNSALQHEYVSLFDSVCAIPLVIWVIYTYVKSKRKPVGE